MLNYVNYDLIPLQQMPTTMNATTIESAGVNVRNYKGYSFFVEWSGTPTGDLKLQCSNDPVGTPSSFEDIANSTVAISGAAGSQVYNVFDVYYAWVRVVYEGSSGTGTITAVKFCSKD